MYNWRQLNTEEKKSVLNKRRESLSPWHSPSHIKSESSRYILTAACYEHQMIIGESPERMARFEKELVDFFTQNAIKLYGWVILPNHYHVLIQEKEIVSLLKKLFQLQGKCSFLWNGEDNKRGRHIWCNVLERSIKNDRHFYASLNYIHHNPIKHNYVTQWNDWSYSSANLYLNQKGREQVLREWQEFDIADMGQKWDEF